VRLTLARLDAIDALAADGRVDTARRDGGALRAPALWHAADAGHEWAIERLVAGARTTGEGHSRGR
jgi:hypothetical protein